MTNDDPQISRTDVAVVGGGLAGAAAAITAARAGRSVTLFDARTDLGGRARSALRDGFTLNEGPHALYRSGAAWRFLEQEDLTPTGGYPGAAGVGVDGDLVGVLPAGVLTLLRSSLVKGERIRFGKWFAALDGIDTDALQTVTVAEEIERVVGAGRAARLAHAVMRLGTYGNDVDAMSVGPAIDQLRDALDTPVMYVDGGWGSISHSLHRRGGELGVELVKGCKVDSVREVGDRCEVRAGDRVVHADAVVLAAGGPRQVEAMTGVDPAPWARPSTAAALDVGFDGPWGDFPTFALGLDEPLYMSVHAPLARLAPGDRALASVLLYHPFGETPDADADRAACERLLDRVRPGWRERARFVEFRARLQTAYDQPQAARGGLAGRAPIELEGRDRIFVAGDWVGPEGVLADAVVASAVAAATAAVAR